MKKLYAALAVLPLLGLSGVALAQQPIHQPMQLTNAQMDNVTAGQSISGVLINLLAVAAGTDDAATMTVGAASIVQDPVVVTLSGVTTTVFGGLVYASGSSYSSNN